MLITILQIFIGIYLTGNLIFTYHILKNYTSEVKEVREKNLIYLLFVCLGVGTIIYFYFKLDKSLNH